VLLAVGLALAADAAAQARSPLRLGVVSFYNPRLMYTKYQPLVDYLAAHTGTAWELELQTSYDRTVDALCAGRVDVAYLGPFSYLRAHARCGALPAVHLLTDGRATYRGYIMVRSDSPVRSLADLKGQTIAFGAAMATSSSLVARAMLQGVGLRLGTDLACRNYSQHDRAARAVLLGQVAACAVRDIVGEKYLSRGLRIVAESDPLPNFALVVAPAQAARLRDMLVKALVALPQRDQDAGATIASWDEELAGGFAVATEAEFEPVRELAVRVFGPRALLLPEDEATCAAEGR
jgi:phosphonate transport system substrate-binding protein